MSSRSGRDKQSSEGRPNGEGEPFLVPKIPGSPVMRGRRQISAEERFVVEDIPRSPIMRGRRQISEEERFVVEDIPGSPQVIRGRRPNSEEERFVVETIPESPATRRIQKNSEEERFLIQDIPRSPVIRGRASRSTPTTGTNLENDPSTDNVPGWNLSPDRIDHPANNARTTPTNTRNTNRHNGPPDNEDAPPSYESSIPPSHIGWKPEVTSNVLFPMPIPVLPNEERLTFIYPPDSPEPSMELSPLVKSYLSIESHKSRSLGPSTTPSTSPSPDRLRPAYTYQQRAVRVVKTPMNLQCRRDYENDVNFAIKPHNEFSYKYGGIIIAIICIVFMMLLSLAVKFLIRNGFN